MLKGIAASEGIGIGRAVIIAPQEITYQTGPVADIEQEKARLHRAIDDFISYTEELAGKLEETLDAENADIIRGHVTMLSDPFMIEEMEELIAGGQSAEAAAESVLDMFQGLFQSAEDELTRQRATDVEDIKRKLLEILLGMEQLDLKHLPDHTVLVVSDLAPSVTAEMDHDSVIGVVTENGGMTSHSAILSRALEIPAVLSVPDALSKIKDGQKLIVDGTNGTVIVDPSAETTVKYQTCRDDYIREKELLKAFQGKATVTRDGDPRQVFCNIGNPKDAESAAEHDGEGIGLFRTEFLFMDRDARPDEETQYAAYRQVCETLKGKTVIIRTLDVGGDKDIPYIHMEKEENPFLGYRAVRYCLSNQEAYKIQLRALIRAGADTGGNLRIMIPMVTTATEIQTVRRLAEEICRETRLPMPEIGTMIETPAAFIMADVLAKYSDFFSIGTNDLTQYIMAADRGNSSVAYLYKAYDPAVLRALRAVITAGVSAGIPVGMCGEAAADPLLIPLLIGFGMEEFSVSPAAVLKTRREISRWTVTEAKKIADHVLTLETADEVERYIAGVGKR
jgi:phosphotransferase system enzyme I (PtsI)